jgi:hypothetical protein
VPITCPELVDTLSDALANGLAHPKNPSSKAAVLFLPGLRGKTMPPPLAEAVEATRRLIAEAILELIDQTHTITPKDTDAP